MVESIFSNTASPIDDIEKAYIYFHTDESKYLPHFNTSCGNSALVLYIYIFNSNVSSMVISMWGLDNYESKHTGSVTNVLADKNI